MSLFLRVAGLVFVFLFPILTYAQVDMDMGIKYWKSRGKTIWNFTNGNPAFGDPTSQLAYDDMKGKTAEIVTKAFWRKKGFFLKGTVGIGDNTNGTLRDEDWFAGQVKFSDTDSNLRDGSIDYFLFDGGTKLYSSSRGGTRVDGFLGLGLYNEKIDAYGVVQKIPGPVGQVVDESAIVIVNNQKWTLFRAGVDITTKLSERFSFRTNAAWVPVAQLSNDDSHILRNDLGEVPNVLIKGRGDGFMLDAEFALNVTKAATLTAGYRYWGFKLKGGEVFGLEDSVKKFSFQREGILLGFSYKF